MWGYAPIPGAHSADDEKQTLDSRARQQDGAPHLRFSTARSRGGDPGELTEAVGDEDAVASTTLGLKNLARVAAMPLPATTAQPGEPFDDLEELSGRLLGQWALELNHVAAIVVGFSSQHKHAGQPSTSIAKTRFSSSAQVERCALDVRNAERTPGDARSAGPGTIRSRYAAAGGSTP